MISDDDHELDETECELPPEFPERCMSSSHDSCMPVVKKIHSHDILFGRGNAVNNHNGNVFFRRLVSHRKRDYRKGAYPDMRRMCAFQIYDEIYKLDPPGRFLMPTPSDCNKWYEVGQAKALRKISQALRERSPYDPPEIVSPKVSSETSIASLRAANRSSTSEESVVKIPTINNSCMYPLVNTLKVSQFEGKMAGELQTEEGASSLNVQDAHIPDKLTLDFLHRYQLTQKARAIFERNNLQSSITDNISLTTQSTSASELDSSTNSIDCNQAANLLRRNDKSNVSQSNKLFLGKHSYGAYFASHPDNKDCAQNSSPEVCAKIDDQSSLNLNERSIHSKPYVSKRKHKVSLPEIDDDQLSIKIRQTQYKMSKSVSKSSTSSKQNNNAISSKTVRGKKPRTSVEDPRKELKTRKQPDHHQQVIMPLSYIGQSFLNSANCTDESKSVFEEIAELGKRTKGDALLYLPSIIGSLCKRVLELEDKKTSDED